MKAQLYAFAWLFWVFALLQVCIAAPAGPSPTMHQPALGMRASTPGTTTGPNQAHQRAKPMEMTHLSAKKRPWALVLGICFLIFGALLLLCIPVSFYIITLILFSTLGSLLVLLGVVFLAISGGAGYKSASKPLTEPALRPRRRPGETDGPKFRSR